MFKIIDTNFNFSHLYMDDEYFTGYITVIDQDDNVKVSQTFTCPSWAVPVIGTLISQDDLLMDYLD